MNQGQTQRRRHYQLWGGYFLIGGALMFLGEWFAVPRILSDGARVVYIVGMVVLTAISQPLGEWRSRLPELVTMLVLAGVALVVPFIIGGDLRYTFPIMLFLWGSWFLTRSALLHNRR